MFNEIPKNAIPVFIFDNSIMSKMIEKTSTEDKLIKLISEMKVNNIPFKAYTTLNSFKRAIWKADPETKLLGIQELLDIIEIIPTEPIDHRNKKAVMKDIIDFAGEISHLGCDGSCENCEEHKNV